VPDLLAEQDRPGSRAAGPGARGLPGIDQPSGLSRFCPRLFTAWAGVSRRDRLLDRVKADLDTDGVAEVDEVVGDDVAGFQHSRDAVLGSAAPGLGEDDDGYGGSDPVPGDLVMQGQEVGVGSLGGKQGTSVADDAGHQLAACCRASSAVPRSAVTPAGLMEHFRPFGGELSRAGGSSSKSVVDLPLGEDAPSQRGQLPAKAATSLQPKKILHEGAEDAPPGKISPVRIRRLTK